MTKEELLEMVEGVEETGELESQII